MQLEGVADRGGRNSSGIGRWGLGIGPKGLGTSQAQVRGVDADALVAFRIGAVGVLFVVNLSKIWNINFHRPIACESALVAEETAAFLFDQDCSKSRM
jgi:hypothetical protein